MYDVHRMYGNFILNLRKKNVSEGKIRKARDNFSLFLKRELMSRDQLKKYRVESFFEKEKNITKWQNYYTEKPSDCPDKEWPLFKKKDQVDKGAYGWGPIHRAVMENNLDLVKKLVSDGEDVTMLDNGGNTPFELSVLEDKEEIMEWFINNGY